MPDADLSDTLPTVYVVIQGEWSTGDVAGALLTEGGEALWGHMSSSVGWLQRDLTNGFSDRRDELDRRYPGGYRVVVSEGWDKVPGPVQHAHKAWAEASDGE